MKTNCHATLSPHESCIHNRSSGSAESVETIRRSAGRLFVNPKHSLSQQNDGVIDIMQEQEQEEPNNSTDHRPINPNPLKVVTCLLLNKLVEILICVGSEGLSDHAPNQVMFILNHPA